MLIKQIYIIILLTALILIGCSKNNQTPSSTDLLPDTEQEKETKENITRFLTANEHDIWPNTPQYVTEFATQGTSYDNGFLIDCMDATFYHNTDGSDEWDMWNYVLVCGTYGKWDSAADSTCQLWKVSRIDTPACGTDSSGTITNTIRDPDACCVFTDNQNVPQVHALIYDSYTQKIKHYARTFDEDTGALTNSWTYISADDLDFSSGGFNLGYEVTDIEVVITDCLTPRYDVIVTVKDDGKAYVFRYDDNYDVWLILDTLDDFTGKPVSVCACVYDNTDEWYVYIGVQASDWDNDFIYCYRYNGTSYGTGHAAEQQGGSEHKFKGIIQLANGKSGLNEDEWGIEFGHYYSTVCVLMYQPDLRGYKLRQVDFDSGLTFYSFIQDFEPWNISASPEIDWPEAFAVGRQWYDATQRYRGYLYFLGSRNCDLEANENVRVYENTPS